MGLLLLGVMLLPSVNVSGSFVDGFVVPLTASKGGTGVPIVIATCSQHRKCLSHDRYNDNHPFKTHYTIRQPHLPQQYKPPVRTALQLAGLAPALPSTPKTTTRATAVHALLLCNLAVFVVDKIMGWSPNLLGQSFVARHCYLHHRQWRGWQLVTSTFCHADRNHLSNNLFLLLLFGRSVEDDQGWGGLLTSYIFCGVVANLVSLFLLPKYTVSLGASGAVFGLFAVSTLAKLSSWNEIFNWRKLVEVAVLGEFVFRQLATELSTTMGGGRAGVNHVAHLAGAVAGAVLVFGMRSIVGKYDNDIGQPKKLKKK